MQLRMSTFAVEKGPSPCDMRRRSGTAPGLKEVEMRIVETGAAGIIAIASQILMVAVVLL